MLENHTDAVHDIAIRPGATDALPMLASVSTDRTVRLWQPTIGRLVRFTRLDAEPLAVAWSSDGELVVVGCGDGSVRLIDPETVESVATERVLEKVWAVAVSPKHGAAVAAGTPLGESGRSLSRSISMRTRTSDRTREEP